MDKKKFTSVVLHLPPSKVPSLVVTTGVDCDGAGIHSEA